MKMKWIILELVLLLGLSVQMKGYNENGKPFYRNISALEYKGHNGNYALACDSASRLYVANFEGLIVYDGAEWKMNHTPGISRVTDIFRANDGTIWFGGHNVLGKVLCKDSIEIEYAIRDDKEAAFGEIDKIYEEEGKLYFITYNKVLYSYKDGKVVKEKENVEQAGKSQWNGLTVNQMITLPDLKMTALATTNEGIIVIDEKGTAVYHLTTADGLCSNEIKSISYDGKGCLWGATNNGLFSVILSFVYTHFGESEGLVGQVTAILKHESQLYVGTLQGIFQLGANGMFHKMINSDIACWKLYETEEGNVLAATAEGIYLIGNDMKQLTTNHTLTLFQEKDMIVAGELDGIHYYTLSGKEIKKENISNVVIFKEEGNEVWALTLYHESFCKAYGSDSFVKKDNKDLTLLCKYVDYKGRAWNSKNNDYGIRCSSLNKNQQRWFTPLDAYVIQTMEITSNEGWFGGNFGLIRLDLDNIERTDAYNPTLYIRSFQQEGPNVSLTAASNKIDPIGTTYYSYRLHEKDNWSKWNEDQHLVFNHLSLGNYQLAVRSMDSYGNIVQSETIAFEVPAPIYAKWYAILFYIVVVAFLVYGFFRLRLRRAQQEQLRLENIVNERTKELKDAQKQLIRQEHEATVGKLTKGLIDRILNPMNYINNFSHLTLGLTKDLRENIQDEEKNMSEENFEDSMDVVDMMKTNLEKIEQHGLATTRILKSMEELLKERSGRMEPTNLKGICQQNIDMLKQYKKEEIEEFQICVEAEIPEIPIVADLNANNISRVFLSILFNAIYAVKKKAQKGEIKDYQPLVKLSIYSPSGEKPPIISIYDNGIGMEEGIVDKIFDPFFTTKPTAEAAGVGLYLCQQIIQDFNGKILVDSVKDEYTEFKILLP